MRVPSNYFGDFGTPGHFYPPRIFCGGGAHYWVYVPTKMCIELEGRKYATKYPCKVGVDWLIRPFISTINDFNFCRTIDDSNLYVLKFNLSCPCLEEPPDWLLGTALQECCRTPRPPNNSIACWYLRIFLKASLSLSLHIPFVLKNMLSQISLLFPSN